VVAVEVEDCAELELRFSQPQSGPQYAVAQAWHPVDVAVEVDVRIEVVVWVDVVD
jgi:hypothetical protein